MTAPILCARVKLGYETFGKLKKMEPDAYASLHAEVGAALELPEDQSGLDEYRTWQERVLDAHELEVISAVGPVELTKVRGLAERVGALPAGDVYNLTIPDVGLLSVRRVDTLFNCDEIELQEHLDDGWRIVAVLPADAGGLPGYVVGRA